MIRGLFSIINIGTYILPTCRPLCTFSGPFWGAQMPQNIIKNYFLVVLDYFFCMNGPNDLVRGLFSSSDIGTYIPPTCKPLWTFLGPCWGAKMPKDNIKKTIIWLFWTIYPRTMGLMIWLGVISKLIVWAVHPAYLRAFVCLCRFIWGCPNAAKQHKKLFSDSFELFLLQDWAY
jgi:hypothetical protein